VASRQSAPVIGAQGYTYNSPGTWLVSVGYRYQRSDRHFRGIHEEANRQAEHSEVINDIHLFDLSITYALNARYSLNLSVPILDMNRSQALRDVNRNIIGRFATQSGGFGDISLMARGWLLDPAKNNRQNVLVGFGIKMPTGDNDVTDEFQTLTGPVVRTVDQSIQPGDGGWGIVFEASAFKMLTEQFTLFSTVNYLSNPKGTNGVPTFRSRETESIMSVADQYLGRIGVAFPIWSKYQLSGSLAARVEGVPVRDLFGPSLGFRRPGYAFSIEPGIVFSHRLNTFSLAVPVAMQRNRQKSVPDEIDDDHGDAAFADYLIFVSYGRRF